MIDLKFITLQKRIAALKLCYYVIYIFFVTGLAFYDWESQELIRRIEIQPKNVYWSSENGAELVCISTEVSFIKVSTKNRYTAGVMVFHSNSVLTNNFFLF